MSSSSFWTSASLRVWVFSFSFSLSESFQAEKLPTPWVISRPVSPMSRLSTWLPRLSWSPLRERLAKRSEVCLKSPLAMSEAVIASWMPSSIMPAASTPSETQKPAGSIRSAWMTERCTSERMRAAMDCGLASWACASITRPLSAIFWMSIIDC